MFVAIGRGSSGMYVPQHEGPHVRSADCRHRRSSEPGTARAVVWAGAPGADDPPLGPAARRRRRREWSLMRGRGTRQSRPGPRSVDAVAVRAFDATICSAESGNDSGRPPIDRQPPSTVWSSCESGRRDLNPRPPEPHSGALPGCATSRQFPQVSESNPARRSTTTGRRSRTLLVSPARDRYSSGGRLSDS